MAARPAGHHVTSAPSAPPSQSDLQAGVGSLRQKTRRSACPDRSNSSPGARSMPHLAPGTASRCDTRQNRWAVTRAASRRRCNYSGRRLAHATFRAGVGLLNVAHERATALAGALHDRRAVEALPAQKSAVEVAHLTIARARRLGLAAPSGSKLHSKLSRVRSCSQSARRIRSESCLVSRRSVSSWKIQKRNSAQSRLSSMACCRRSSRCRGCLAPGARIQAPTRPTRRALSVAFIATCSFRHFHPLASSIARERRTSPRRREHDRYAIRFGPASDLRVAVTGSARPRKRAASVAEKIQIGCVRNRRGRATPS